MKKTLIILTLACAFLATGCTSQSTMTAIASQKRVNAVDEAIFKNQADNLKQVLYDRLVVDLERSGGGYLNDAQKVALSQAWNDRDLLEFWSVQHEKSKAYRLVGVDAKLYNDQGILDLFLKSAEDGWVKAKLGLADAAGTVAGVKTVEAVKNAASDAK